MNKRQRRRCIVKYISCSHLDIFKEVEGIDGTRCLCKLKDKFLTSAKECENCKSFTLNKNASHIVAADWKVLNRALRQEYGYLKNRGL